MSALLSDETMEEIFKVFVSLKELSPFLETLSAIEDDELKSFCALNRAIFIHFVGLKNMKEGISAKYNYIVNNLDEFILRNNNDNNDCTSCMTLKETIKNLLNSAKGNFTSSFEQGNGSEIIADEIVNSSQKSLSVKRKFPFENLFCTSKKSKPDGDHSASKILAPETQALSPKAPETIKKMTEAVLVIPETLVSEQIDYGNTDFFGKFSIDDSATSLLSGKLLEKVSENQSNPRKTSPVFGTTQAFGNLKRSLNDKNSELRNAAEVSQNTINSQMKTSELASPLISSFCSDKKKSPRDETCNSASKKKAPSDGARNTPSKKGTPSNKCSDSQDEKKLSGTITSREVENANTSLNIAPSTSKIPLKKSFSDVSPIDRSTPHTFKPNRRINSLVPKYPLTVETHRPARSKLRKNYRQTKITPEMFLPKTNIASITGGLIGKNMKVSEEKMALHDEADPELEAAIKESLKAKEVEDIMREKRNSIKMKPPSMAEFSDNGPFGQFDIAQISDEKKSEAPLIVVEEQTFREEPKEKNRKEDAAQSTSYVYQLALPMENDDNVSTTLEVSLAKPEMTGQQKCVGYGKFEQDSFDVIPVKHGEPRYAYKDAPIRKKLEKKLVEGWDCHECRGYFHAKGLSPEQTKLLLNKCSRHRSKFMQVTSTPNGFWNPDWDSICEDEEVRTVKEQEIRMTDKSEIGILLTKLEDEKSGNCKIVRKVDMPNSDKVGKVSEERVRIVKGVEASIEIERVNEFTDNEVRKESTKLRPTMKFTDEDLNLRSIKVKERGIKAKERVCKDHQDGVVQPKPNEFTDEEFDLLGASGGQRSKGQSSSKSSKPKKKVKEDQILKKKRKTSDIDMDKVSKRNKDKTSASIVGPNIQGNPVTRGQLGLLSGGWIQTRGGSS